MYVAYGILESINFLIVRISYFFEDTIFLDLNMITLKTSKNLAVVKKVRKKK